MAPGVAETHNGLGTALYQAGDRQGAIEQFQEALQINPNYDEARRNLARVQNLR